MNAPSGVRPARASAWGYDLFKLIVAIILILLLLWLLLRGPVLAPAPGVSGVLPAADLTATMLALEAAAPVASATAGVQSTAVSAVEPTTAPTQPEPTATTAATAAAAPTATTAPTPVPAAELTATPAPTAAPTTAVEPTAAPTAAPAASSGCPLAAPSRLAVGKDAKVIRNLNMRAQASFGSPLMLTNPTGTTLAVTGGPVCEPYQGGAYQWWQVARSDGQTGWSAEASLAGSFYFLEPVP